MSEENPVPGAVVIRQICNVRMTPEEPELDDVARTRSSWLDCASGAYATSEVMMEIHQSKLR